METQCLITELICAVRVFTANRLLFLRLCKGRALMFVYIFIYFCTKAGEGWIVVIFWLYLVICRCVQCKSIDYNHAHQVLGVFPKRDIFTFGFILVFILFHIGFNNFQMDVGKMKHKGHCHKACKLKDVQDISFSTLKCFICCKSNDIKICFHISNSL